MKIVTINVPEAYIEAIEHLVGDKGLYPSRSELIRCAVREFLIKEIGMAKAIKDHPKIKESDPDMIYVPVMDHSDFSIESRPKPKKWKVYNVIRRLT